MCRDSWLSLASKLSGIRKQITRVFSIVLKFITSNGEYVYSIPIISLNEEAARGFYVLAAFCRQRRLYVQWSLLSVAIYPKAGAKVRLFSVIHNNRGYVLQHISYIYVYMLYNI